MANKQIFASVSKPQTVLNEAGGKAYSMNDKAALAQLACTGTLSNTFYTTAQDQLDTVLALANKVPVDFLAKVAIYSREEGYMKDMPALLTAVLSVRDPNPHKLLFHQVFQRVIDNGKMLRNFVQIIRSGKVGRKSLGSAPKRAIQRWFASRNPDAIFRQSVGNDPTLADVIRLAHPRDQQGILAYLLDKGPCTGVPVVDTFEALKKGQEVDPELYQKLPFQLISSLPLTPNGWKYLAKGCSWQTLRMNLNTFQRHGVFKDPGMVTECAEKLRDRKAIRAARVFPYQLLTAYIHSGGDVPQALGNALQDALEIAVENVPRYNCRVVVCPDVSGSMSSPVTGYRPGQTTAVSCNQVAGLVASSIARVNEETLILPFGERVFNVKLNPRDSIMTNARMLASLPGGGTDCSLPLRFLNQQNVRADLIVFVSDNESWIDSRPVHGYYGARGTSQEAEWKQFKTRNPQAKMVCIDLTPNTTVQVKDRPDVLNVGGFSDSVFDVMNQFLISADPGHWAQVIDRTEIWPSK